MDPPGHCLHIYRTLRQTFFYPIIVESCKYSNGQLNQTYRYHITFYSGFRLVYGEKQKHGNIIYIQSSIRLIVVSVNTRAHPHRYVLSA